MGVLSFRLRKIEGDIGNQIGGELKITSTLPKIKKISKKEIKIGENKTDALSIDFEYVTKYEPIKAKISIEGEVLFTDENQKEILKKWDKEKKLDERVALPILNYIFKRCAIQSIKIADDLQLPPPVRLPDLIKRE